MLSSEPTFIGLSGLAGSGKTTIANLLAPPLRNLTLRGESLKNPPPLWSHYTLASPLHEIVGIIRQTEGDNRESRILYGLYDILSQLLEKRIPFDDLVEYVKSVAAWDIGASSDPKPRTMMQTVGDECRAIYEDCFVNSTIRKARIDTVTMISEFGAEIPTDYLDEIVYPAHYAVVSDVRYQNELDKLREASSLIMVKLDVSFNTARERVYERDGAIMTEEEWKHPTEAGFPDEVYDLIVNAELEHPEQDPKENIARVTSEIRQFILNYNKPDLEVSLNG